MNKLFFFILLCPFSLVFSQEKELERLEEAKEEIRQEIMIKMISFEKKIDSLKIILIKEKGEKRELLDQALDQMEVKRKDLKEKLDGEKRVLVNSLEEFRKDLEKSWEDFKDSFRNLEDQLSTEQGNNKASEILWK